GDLADGLARAGIDDGDGLARTRGLPFSADEHHTFHACLLHVLTVCEGRRAAAPAYLPEAMISATARPTSTVLALPPMSRVRGPSISTVSMASMTAFSASG